MALSCLPTPGLACLHISTLKGNIEMMSLLLQSGANIDVQVRTGCQEDVPRLWGREALRLDGVERKDQGRWGALGTLHPRPCCPQEGTSGKTPLHLAVECCNRRAVQFLLLNGAYVDAQMYNGCTPLHLAVCHRDAAIASILSHSGADTLLRNMENETAQDLADGNDDVSAGSAASPSWGGTSPGRGVAGGDRRRSSLDADTKNLWSLQLLALLPFDDLKISGKPVVCSE